MLKSFGYISDSFNVNARNSLAIVILSSKSQPYLLKNNFFNIGPWDVFIIIF